jgi:hypothetical protein
MTSGSRFLFPIICIFILISCTALVSGAGLGVAWKVASPSENPYLGVTFTENDSRVFAGGQQMLVRTWSGSTQWGGKSGMIAMISPDGNYVVSSIGKSVQVLDNNGEDFWSRNMDGQIRAVAVSRNGSLVITADDKNNINSWAYNGEFIGRNQIDLVKSISISPKEDLVVMATEGGLRYFSPSLNMMWSDNKSGSLDTYILFSADGSTIITAGGNRVSSHTNTGALNWMKDITRANIIDIACSEDCSRIVIGSQDKSILLLDGSGKTLWEYSTDQWVNGVGISDDAKIIAGGTLDRMLFVLNQDGKLIAKLKADSIIQQRSVAVSGDGTRIAFSDQLNLYGYNILGNTEPLEETYTPTPQITTRRTTAVPTTTVTTIAPVTREETPVPTSTPMSPLEPLLVLGAIAGLVMLFRKQ